MALRTIGVRLRMETSDLRRDGAAAGATVDGLSGKLNSLGAKGGLNLDKVARGLGIVGAALTGLAGAAVYAALNFDKQMSEVGAVANATAGQLQQLRDAAIEAGQATVFSASDAAKAEAELAKAGVSTADILGGALTGALSLASAGTLDLADAATISANAMNTFGLSGKDVSHIADVLSAGANKSAASVEDLGLGLQQVGLVAHQVGLSFEETVGLLSAFADRGLRGSDGATSLKTALQRLAAPTDTAAAAMKALKISFYNADGSMRDIVDVAGNLQDALKDLSPAQRNAALQTIFGTDAIRAANVLYTEGAKGIQNYVDAVNDQGAASRVAAQKMDNLAGDVEQLKGSLETLFISSGEGANSGLRTLAKGLTEVVNAFSSLPAGIQSTTIVVAGLTGAALLLAAGGIKVKTTLAEINTQLMAMGPAGERAATGLRAVTSAGLKVGGVLAILQVASTITGAFDNWKVSTDGLTQSLRHLANTGEVSGELQSQFGADLKGLQAALSNATSGGKDFATTLESITGLSHSDGSWTKNIERIQALDAALAQLVSSGNADEANADFKQIYDQAVKAGVSLDALQSVFPNYIKAAGDAAKATAAAADDTAQLNRAQVAAVKSGQMLADVWEQLHGAMVNADKAMLEADNALADLKDAFDQNGRGISGNTKAAVENRVALEEAAQKAVAAADAFLQNGGSAAQATKMLKDFEDAAVKATGATGKQKDAVKALADQLFSLPANVSTTVTTINRTVEGNFRAGERRWGGVDVHAARGGIYDQAVNRGYVPAAVGRLRDAAVYPPASPGRYMIAEPQTKGEAFVPKSGDYGRSMTILAAAAGWYNADVVPRQGWYGGSGSVAGHVDVRVQVEDPRGRVLHESLTTYAVDTGRAPADLWSAKRR